MTLTLVWTRAADETREHLERAARSAMESRVRKKKAKASRQEELFKQVMKTIELLAENPRHPWLQTHEYASMPKPYDPSVESLELVEIRSR